MIVGVLSGTKQLEILGKWWYLFYAGVWVYLGVRSYGVFTVVCYLILGFGLCLIVSWLFFFFVSLSLGDSHVEDKGRVALERILANFVCISNKSVTK